MKKTLEIDEELYASLKRTRKGTYVTEVDFTLKVGVSKLTFSSRMQALAEANKKSKKRRRQRRAIDLRNETEDGMKVLAHRFARTFLQKDKYPGLSSKPRTARKFRLAAKKVSEYAKEVGASEREVRTWLLQAVEEEYKPQRKTVKIGHLSSDYTWDILVPQHMERVAPKYVKEDD